MMDHCNANDKTLSNLTFVDPSDVKLLTEDSLCYTTYGK